MRKKTTNTSTASKPQFQKLPDSIFRKSVLPDGIRVVTEYIPYVRSVSIGFWLEVGTRDETPDINGVSHFIEHMLFKGTTKRSAIEIAQSIENVGGHLNAFTSKELTCYYAQVLDDDLVLAVDVLTDMLTNSIFAPEEIEKERDVILEEIKSADEVPEERVHEYFYHDLFANHPLALSTLGTKTSVKSLAREDALQYMKHHYARNRLVVSVCGNIEHESVCKLLEGKLANWQPSQARKLQKPTPVPAQVKTRTEESVQAHICLGSQALAFSDQRKYTALVMNTLLGVGMGSRLFQSVREEHGLCYNIYSYLDFLFDTGVFCIYTGTDREKTDKALELIHDELMSLRNNRISEEELARTKSQLKGNLMLSLENTSNRMNRLAKMEIYLQNYVTLDEVVRGIDAVTPEDVLEVSRFILDPDGLTTTIIKP